MGLAMKSLAASREVSTPSSNPQICNLLCAASGGELDPEGLKSDYTMYAIQETLYLARLFRHFLPGMRADWRSKYKALASPAIYLGATGRSWCR